MSVHISGTGNIAADPQGKRVGNKDIATLFVLNNRQRKIDDGEYETTHTTPLNITIWDERLAEYVLANFSKGDAVRFSGQLDLRTYEKDNGDEGYSLDVNINWTPEESEFFEKNSRRVKKAAAKPAAKQKAEVEQEPEAASEPDVEPEAPRPAKKAASRPKSNDSDWD